MNKKIGIIGGDLRIIRLAEILAEEGYEIYTYALESYDFFDENILKCNQINIMCDNCNYIICGIPFSKDGVHINTPFSKEQIKTENLLNILKNKTLISGAINNNIEEKANGNSTKIVDLLKFEELTILNTIPTVEGAIQVAMEKTEFTIYDSTCLILGYGRIGKLLTKTLKNLGAKVSCVARKESDLTWISTYGYKAIHLDNLNDELSNSYYDIIFNTIPKIILDGDKIEKIKNKNTLIIELASNPGGIDNKKAAEYNIKIVKALGLPGKVAPLTAAKYIKSTLDKNIFNKQS